MPIKNVHLLSVIKIHVYKLNIFFAATFHPLIILLAQLNLYKKRVFIYFLAFTFSPRKPAMKFQAL